MKLWQGLILGIFFGLLAAGLIILIATPVRGQPVNLLPPPTASPLTVYITGEVNHPSVYTLPPHSRVSDVVEAAGGLTNRANTQAINLAELIWDGEKIIIPANINTSRDTTNPDQPGIATPSASNPLNINTATLEELEQLPGIGPTKAQNIFDYRQKHGPFQTLDELLNVDGIGPGIFEKIKDRVTTGVLP